MLGDASGNDVQPSEQVHLSPTRYASQRLAHAVIQGSRAAHDLKTLSAWGREVGASAATLRTWCYAARERPKLVLDFVRVLRALTMWQGAEWHPLEAFDITVPRTLSRLFKRGNVEFLLTSPTTPSRDTFVRRQQYVANKAIVATVLAHIARDR